MGTNSESDMELSKTGREIRKDSFEAKHNMDFVRKCLRKLYLDDQLSTTKIPYRMKEEFGIDMTAVKCYHLIKNMGIVRTKSESVSLAKSSLDSSTSLLNEKMTGIIEGILIGDGTININRNTKKGRLSISGAQEEFITYCYKLLKPYGANIPVYRSSSEHKKGMGTWTTRTKFHPDFYQIHNKWYVPGKDIPSNLNFTKLMLLLWYLVDGSLSNRQVGNSLALYFATNSFSMHGIESLRSKFEKIGVQISRITSDRRLFIKTASIPTLLNYMGGQSPVQCYSYKFDIDAWRLKKSMKDTALELDLDYGKLANWVKTGIVSHLRSPGGKKVLFSDKEFNELKRRLDDGELSRVKGKKAKRNHITNNDMSVLKQKGEDDSSYVDRIAKSFIINGFPYKDYSFIEKQRKWTRVRASQYIIPDIPVLKWRKHGLALADSFHPHIYELNRKGKISPYTLFHNEDMFIQCLKNNNAQNGTMTTAKVLSAVCADVRSPRLNNFSPALARDVYNYFCKDGDCVIDPCAGFSGRLLGASISKKHISYTGIEPSIRTYEGLVRTKIFLNKVRDSFTVNIENGRAENVLCKYRDSFFDFCFTSPPYFDTEEYDVVDTQSHLKYSSYDTWKSQFLHVMMAELYRVLKKNSYCVINIGQFGKYDISKDLEDIARDIGFVLLERKYISFPIYGFVKSESKERLEPMLVLNKN